MFYIITAVTIDAFGNSLPADSANKDRTQRPETGATDSDKTLLEASARTQPATANRLPAARRRSDDEQSATGIAT